MARFAPPRTDSPNIEVLLAGDSEASACLTPDRPVELSGRHRNRLCLLPLHWDPLNGIGELLRPRSPRAPGGTGLCSGDQVAPNRELTSVEGLFDGASSLWGGNVLPDAHRRPSSPPELLVCVPVPLHVPLDLLRPVPGVGAVSTNAMLRTTVPEAAVDEHCHLYSREDDVRLPTEARQWAPVHEVAEPPSVELSAQRQLWSGVLPGQAAHLASHGL